MRTDDNYDILNRMRRFFRYLRGYELKAVAAPLFKLGEVVLELLIPFIVASVIDRGIPSGDAGFVFGRFGIMLACGAGGLLLAVVAQYFSAKTASAFSCGVRKDLFDKIESLPLAAVEKATPSGLVTMLSSDVNNLQTGVNLTLRLLLRSPIVVFGVIIAVFLIDVRSGILFSATIAVLLCLAFFILYFGIRYHKKTQKSLDEMTEMAREARSGGKIFRALDSQDKELGLFRSADDKYRARQVSSSLFSALLDPLSFAVINVAVVLLLWFGGKKADAGELTQGQVVALYNYAALVLVELIKFASLVVTMSRAFAGAKRIAEVMDMPSEKKGSGAVKTCDGYITFDHVSFRYEGARGDALSEITFSLERGEKLGVIGGSGSGKTTLLDLMAKLYDVSSGELFIDGESVADSDPTTARERCAYVLQRSELFSGSIANNLSAGKNRSEEELLAASERAQALSVVKGKGGLGYDLAPAASDLSGGQRQRLSIARAFAKKAPILLLDDCLSALDGKTAAALCKEIYDYDGTVIFASQRVSALKDADKLLVLDDGKMMGFGTHEDLLKNCETYRKICEAQE